MPRKKQKSKKNPERSKKSPKINTLPPPIVSIKASQKEEDPIPVRLGAKLYARTGFQWAWKGLVVLSVVSGLIGLWLEARQDISIDPYVSLDSDEAFQQQFTIKNDGPLAIYDVYYTCSITSAWRKDGRPVMNLPPYVIITMFPILKPHIPTFHWKDKTNTDCDFIARSGQELGAANIEIEVMYKGSKWGWESHRTQKFTGRRDVAGAFHWIYGSPDIGPFDEQLPGRPQKTVILQPF
jgi:hypothetical protein